MKVTLSSSEYRLSSALIKDVFKIMASKCLMKRMYLDLFCCSVIVEVYRNLLIRVDFLHVNLFIPMCRIFCFLGESLGMSSSNLGVTSLCQHGMPVADCNDGQFDTDYEQSRASSEESDSSGSRVGDSSSPGVNLENVVQAARVRNEFHQAYPDLSQRRFAILKGLRHKSAPTYR